MKQVFLHPMLCYQLMGWAGRCAVIGNGGGSELSEGRSISGATVAQLEADGKEELHRRNREEEVEVFRKVHLRYEGRIRRWW